MPQIESFRTHPPEFFIASVGGSLVRPNRLNKPFIADLSTFTRGLLDRGITPLYTFGGGGQARKAKEDMQAMRVRDPEAIDTVGIFITWVNAHMVSSIMKDRGIPVEIQSSETILSRRSFFPEKGKPEKGIVHNFAGLGTKHTTDTITVKIAQETGADTVFNLSNIRGVHPRVRGVDVLDHTVVLEDLTWAEYRRMIPSKHIPSGHTPFDPEASKLAQQLGMMAIFVGGKQSDMIFSNLDRCLRGEMFVGTRINSGLARHA